MGQNVQVVFLWTIQRSFGEGNHTSNLCTCSHGILCRTAGHGVMVHRVWEHLSNLSNSLLLKTSHSIVCVTVSTQSLVSPCRISLTHKHTLSLSLSLFLSFVLCARVCAHHTPIPILPSMINVIDISISHSDSLPSLQLLSFSLLLVLCNCPSFYLSLSLSVCLAVCLSALLSICICVSFRITSHPYTHTHFSSAMCHALQ